MFGEEWPLMMFTLFSQFAIGTFIILIVIRLALSKKIEEKTIARLTNSGLLAVGFIMVVAIVFSLFHLGDPLGAYRSITNPGTSWLSREILSAVVFLGLWFVDYILNRQGRSNRGLEWIAAVMGLIVIYSMASIYSSSIIPAWSNINTYLSFFGTTVVFGCLSGITFVLQAMHGKEDYPAVRGLLKTLSLATLIAVAVQLCYLPLYLTGLGGDGIAAQTSAQLLSGSYAFPLVIRWAFSILGGCIVFYTLYKQEKVKALNMMNIAYVALVLVVIGEFIGRYVFYASAISIKIGS